MSVITGTALTKNTPVTVLKELEYLERSSLAEKERTYRTKHLNERDQRSAPEAPPEPDHISLDQA